MPELDRTSLHPLTRLLLTGICVSALILALGKVNAHRLQARLEQLELACIAEVLDREEETVDGQTPNCDPTILFWTEDPRHPHRGIQGEIVAAQVSLWQQDALLPRLVGGVLVLTAAPWAWRLVRLQMRPVRKPDLDGPGASYVIKRKSRASQK